MSELRSYDGHLAKGPDGNMSIAFPLGQIEPAAVDQFTSHGRQPDQYYDVKGRSGFAIAAHIGLEQTGQIGMVEAGQIYIPSRISHYSQLGSRYNQFLKNALDEASDGELIQIGESPIAFGPIEATGDWQAIEADELAYLAAGKYICAHNYEIRSSSIVVPTSRHELKHMPDSQPRALDLANLSKAGRRFALSLMVSELRQPEDEFNEYTIAMSEFGPGPFRCRVVGIETEQGFLPQNEAASTLHPGRTMPHGRHIRPELRGHQIEVFKTDEAVHKWGNAKVVLEFFKNINGAAAIESRRNLQKWQKLSPQQRETIHLEGHNLMDIVEPVIEPLMDVLESNSHAVVLTPKNITPLSFHSGMSADSRVVNILEALEDSNISQSAIDFAGPFEATQAELKLVANDPCIVVSRPLDRQYIKHLFETGKVELIIVRESAKDVKIFQKNETAA